MKRLFQIILTLVMALNLTAAAAVSGVPCHKPCCERELAREVAQACSDCGPGINAPAMGCCGAVSDAGEAQATLNTGSVLPNFDIASLTGEAQALFTGAPSRSTVKQTFRAYESPPIFILNASFIC